MKTITKRFSIVTIFSDFFFWFFHCVVLLTNDVMPAETSASEKKMDVTFMVKPICTLISSAASFVAIKKFLSHIPNTSLR